MLEDAAGAFCDVELGGTLLAHRVLVVVSFSSSDSPVRSISTLDMAKCESFRRRLSD